MKMTKRGKLWYVDFVNVEGRRQRLSTGQTDDKLARVRAAELMHAHMTDQLDAGERKQLGSHMTLSYILTRQFEEHWRKQAGGKDRRYQVMQLCTAIGHWPLHQVTYARLSDFARELELAGNAPATRNRKLSLIKTAMTECVKRGELQNLPVFPFFKEDNQRTRYVSLEEEAQVLKWFDENVAPADHRQQYFREMFIVGIDTGLRSSEICGLLPERIVAGRIVLPHGKPGKNQNKDDRRDRTKSGKGRSVPMTGRAAKAVEKLLANPIHRTFDPNWASHTFARIMDKVGLPDVGIHTLRHTCASRLVQRGVNMLEVSTMLGHSSLSVTERYAHLSANSLDSLVDELDAYRKGDTGETVRISRFEYQAFLAWKEQNQTPPDAEVPTDERTFPLPETQTNDRVTLRLVK